MIIYCYVCFYFLWHLLHVCGTLWCANQFEKFSIPPHPLQQTQTSPHKLQWLQSLYFSCLLLNCLPPPEQIWHSLHPTWAPVMQSAQFQWSYRKIEKCEQSSQQPSIKSWLPHTLASPTPDCNKNISYTASPTGFLKALWGTHNLRELETSEKHKRVDGGRNEHGARAGSACCPLPITPSINAYLNN